ncbi:clathrin associated protein complex large subunit [Malassezia yamatoensis]|uniref:AP-1 complex subunit gamma n=1 Tax=Malassezia yamatoensis TaxID=253288 RepID=A0AAJ5YT68_9BASI|nr:clathrin associated protein complex large subunit [Malassezia yamatoensis]
MAGFFQKQQQVAALDPRLGGLMASAGLYNLRSLIKGVRACKTLADERSLLQKESAAIRTSFKDDDPFMRYNNLSKLLYIHMLGYPAHFGQMECLKLVASPRFTDKRLGYLGIMLLLDENAQVLMLVTNGLKNMYVVGLALCTFANIASEEMSRDLCNEIEKLMGSANSYIRKKAALCAKRIVRKVPDLVDHFRERTLQLLGDKSHGVQLCALSLAIQICETEPSAIPEYRRATSALVATLKNLLSTSFSPEHDVAGITDPFLQAKILRFLRILGKDSAQVSDLINDILTQVATNTEASKNVGNAILYECVLTILEIQADSALRVMAINILGKFLGNRDNNIRYVALNTLNKVVTIDTNAVQRHRTTILECLRDADISIRRRALELTYTLINDSNVTVLMRELLSFLEIADSEFKTNLTTQMCVAAERFAPDKRWHIDTMLHVLRIAGNYIRDEVLGSFIRLVCHTPELQAYTTQRLYAALHNDLSQHSQTLAAVWVLGEFGETLLEAGSFHDDQGEHRVNAGSILDLITSLLESIYADEVTREYALTTMAKLYVRITDRTQQERILTFFAQYSDAMDVETQKRAIEYRALLQRGEIGFGVLETMPLPEIRRTILGAVSETKPVGSTRDDEDALLDLAGESTRAALTPAKQPTHELLADIFGDDSAMTSIPASSTASTTSNTRSNAQDILGLFDAPAPSGASSIQNTTQALDQLDLLGSNSSARPAPESEAIQEQEAYNKHGLRIAFRVKRQERQVQLEARFTSQTSLSGVSFQAAVPKSQKLQMSPISTTSISPGLGATQTMHVSGAIQAPIRLRVRIAFTSESGESIRDQFDWAQKS